VNVELKGAADMLPCIIVRHSCPHPPRSANTGETWIPRISVGKYQEFQGWYTRIEEFLNERMLRTYSGPSVNQLFEILITRLIH